MKLLKNGKDHNQEISIISPGLSPSSSLPDLISNGIVSFQDACFLFVVYQLQVDFIAYDLLGDCESLSQVEVASAHSSNLHSWRSFF